MASFYKNTLKRWFDVIAAGLGLIIISPVFLIILLMLAIDFKGRPFFFQLRPGVNEKPFKVIKFKTMTNKKDEKGRLLPNHERTTPLGKLLRKTSLDEIPQLINVLRGEMSLVGPRPLLFKYIPLYNKTQRRRHEVKPGITGWAQVNGRNAISWTRKFEYDVWYIDHISFLFDLKILWMTFLKVVFREGVNASDKITMEPFDGSN